MSGQLRPEIKVSQIYGFANTYISRNECHLFFKFLIPVGKGEGKKAIFPVRDLGDLVFCTVCSLSAWLEIECESKTGQKLLLQRRRILWL